jgi:hypothetical protein
LFSSASRAVDFSTSKMPPQQPDRLLDLFNHPFDFDVHGVLYPAGASGAGLMVMTGWGCSGGPRKAQSARTRYLRFHAR